MRRSKLVIIFTTAVLLNVTQLLSQESNIAKLTGVWEIEGTLMGDNGEGWLMPHKPKNPECETKDHVVFKEGGEAFEVFYSSECAENRKEYDWKLDENQIILSKSDVSKPMLLHKVDGDQLILGLRPRPGSDKWMYVRYKKIEE